MQLCRHKNKGWHREWRLNSSPHSHLHAVCLHAGKHAPGGRDAFFPVHTEIQYGRAAVPFSLQKHVKILNLYQIEVRSHSKRQELKRSLFASLLAMTCGNHWFRFFLLAVLSAWNAFPLDSHMVSFSDLPEIFAQLLPSPWGLP